MKYVKVYDLKQKCIYRDTPKLRIPYRVVNLKNVLLNRIICTGFVIKICDSNFLIENAIENLIF